MEQRVYVSILVPAFVVKHELQIEQLLKQTLNLSSLAYEIFEIPSKIGKEFAVKLSQKSISLQDIERTIAENQNLQRSYDKCKESLQAISAELEKILNDPETLKSIENNKIKQKVKHQKKLEEENKHLRRIIKQQLEEKDKAELLTHIHTLHQEVTQLNNIFKEEQHK